MVSVEFFIDVILPAALWPWGGKGGWCEGLKTLPTSCANRHESGSLNLLEPSGPLQGYTGITLPLPPALPSAKCLLVLSNVVLTQDRNCRGWRCL